MELVYDWDLTTIIAVVGAFLGIINTFILILQYKSEKKKDKKADLQSQPNFDITLLYSDKIRNDENIKLNEIANIEDVSFDTVEIELKVVGGVATNVQLDVIPIIDISFYGLSNSTFPFIVSCCTINFFSLATYPLSDNIYSKKAEGNLYFIHALSSAINARLKNLFPNDLVFALAIPQYYSHISYTDSCKQSQDYYLHNNQPINAESFTYSTKDCKCYIHLNGFNIDDKIVEHIINSAFPENQ